MSAVLNILIILLIPNLAAEGGVAWRKAPQLRKLKENECVVVAVAQKMF
jgi:hypothetical protein